MLAESELSRKVHWWIASTCLALIAVTWRLWTPQTVFPQVPALEFLCSAPRWVDWGFVIGLIVGLTCIVWKRGSHPSWNSGLVVVCLLGLFCLDQHRFQPWAYQLLIFAFLGMCCRDACQLKLMRWLIVSIYLYSGISKLDYEFIHGIGQQMLGAALMLFGQQVEQVAPSLRIAIVMSLPVAEIAVSIALLFRESRRIAAIGAMFMHLALILILGPLGLRHGPSVLIWNAQFVVTVYLLFLKPSSSDTGTAPAVDTPPVARPTWWQSIGEAFSGGMICLACVLPIGERFGVWDHWPSWALYAPHSSRVHVYVARSQVTQLPPELVELTSAAAIGDDTEFDWVFVPIDKWSLSTLGAPIYPQARFQLGVARQIAGFVDSEFGVRVVVQKSAHRMTGHRIATTLEYNRQYDEAGQQYVLNTKPRLIN